MFGSVWAGYKVYHEHLHFHVLRDNTVTFNEGGVTVAIMKYDIERLIQVPLLTADH